MADKYKAKWLKKYQRHSRKYGTYIWYTGAEYEVRLSIKVLDKFLREFTIDPCEFPVFKFLWWDFTIPFDTIKDYFAIDGHRVCIEPEEMIERSY